MSRADLRHRAATRRIGHEMAVAKPGHLRIQIRADHEIGPILQEQGRRGRVDNRADTQDQLRTLAPGILHQLDKNLRGEIAPVRELERPHAAIIAGLHHPLGDLGVRMIINGHHTRRQYGLQNLNLVELCHGIYSV